MHNKLDDAILSLLLNNEVIHISFSCEDEAKLFLTAFLRLYPEFGSHPWFARLEEEWHAPGYWHPSRKKESWKTTVYGISKSEPHRYSDDYPFYLGWCHPEFYEEYYPGCEIIPFCSLLPVTETEFDVSELDLEDLL